MNLLNKKEMNDILVVCGGTIPEKQIKRLKDKGIAEVFTPQSTSESIVKYIFSHARAEKQ
jgi:methylmalonyl-CoA mutase C-terminal domain/subunit